MSERNNAHPINRVQKRVLECMSDPWFVYHVRERYCAKPYRWLTTRANPGIQVDPGTRPRRHVIGAPHTAPHPTLTTVRSSSRSSSGPITATCPRCWSRPGGLRAAGTIGGGALYDRAPGVSERRSVDRRQVTPPGARRSRAAHELANGPQHPERTWPRVTGTCRRTQPVLANQLMHHSDRDAGSQSLHTELGHLPREACKDL